MSPLIAVPRHEGGYTWTIASLVSDALAKAEESFGPRNRNFFYAGHEFVDGIPQVWYPRDRKHVVMQLTKSAIGDLDEATFQLAHEVVHLLSPTERPTTNVLEEGIATHFSQTYCQSKGIFKQPTLQSYIIAGGLVRKLLAKNPSVILRIREEQPHIAAVPATLIMKYAPEFPAQLAEALAAPFSR